MAFPEEVAFDKLTEEALDCIAERGYLTMGYLRDAISRNDLKLPDLTDPKDLIRGDHLLRSDDRLDVALDGVYQTRRILSAMAAGYQFHLLWYSNGPLRHAVPDHSIRRSESSGRWRSSPVGSPDRDQATHEETTEESDAGRSRYDDARRLKTKL